MCKHHLSKRDDRNNTCVYTSCKAARREEDISHTQPSWHGRTPVKHQIQRLCMAICRLCILFVLVDTTYLTFMRSSRAELPFARSPYHSFQSLELKIVRHMGIRSKWGVTGSTGGFPDTDQNDLRARNHHISPSWGRPELSFRLLEAFTTPFKA